MTAADTPGLTGLDRDTDETFTAAGGDAPPAASAPRPGTGPDAIDALLGRAAPVVAPLRDARPVTRDNAQASHDALLAADSPGATRTEKLAIAVFAAALHGDEAATAHYTAALEEIDRDLAAPVTAAARDAAVRGPYGDFPSTALAAFNEDGPEFAAPEELVAVVGARLAAALEHTHHLLFHPRDAARERIEVLGRAGWGADGIVTISQEIAFLSFQLRVVAGLSALAGVARTPATPVSEPPSVRPRVSAASAGPDAAEDGPAHPDRFTAAELGWEPWAEPVPEDELTEAQWDALIQRARAKMPYFRLLARDPGILKARTLTDRDIFFTTDSGLPRAERELAAAAVSRFTGCLFCASVHSRFAIHYGKRPDEVQRLLDDGVEAEQPDPRWRAIIDASVALTRTPVAFGAEHLAALRDAGLADDEVFDVIHSAAFFNWANRLMLSLGEPTLP